MDPADGHFGAIRICTAYTNNADVDKSVGDDILETQSRCDEAVGLYFYDDCIVLKRSYGHTNAGWGVPSARLPPSLWYTRYLGHLPS